MSRIRRPGQGWAAGQRIRAAQNFSLEFTRRRGVLWPSSRAASIIRRGACDENETNGKDAALLRSTRHQLRIAVSLRSSLALESGASADRKLTAMTGNFTAV